MCQSEARAIVSGVEENMDVDITGDLNPPTPEGEPQSGLLDRIQMAMSLLIHLERCGTLPLKQDQIRLALDDAMVRLRPLHDENAPRYARLKDMVDKIQAHLHRDSSK